MTLTQAGLLLASVATGPVGAAGRSGAMIDVARAPAFMVLEHRRSSANDTPTAEAVAAPRPGSVDGRGRAASTATDRRRSLVLAVEIRQRLPVGLRDAVVAEESSYLPWQVSRRGAIGLTQLMPATAQQLGVLDPFDPLSNLDGGARYLRGLLDRFGSISLALAAYNAGPAAVRRARGLPRYRETRSYVARVIARWRQHMVDAESRRRADPPSSIHASGLDATVLVGKRTSRGGAKG